jgi:glyoxylase-like metal-dependent hydrolase (beta-lactamase superfamily II)
MIANLAGDVRAFTSNVFLVTGDRTTLVDTGANFDIVSAVREHVETLDACVITHTHDDHVGNVPAVRDAFDVSTQGFDTEQPAVDERLADETTVQIGDDEYVALHTPGHKNDHLCLYSARAGVLFAGDLVFANGSYGRTDLAEGDQATLIESIDRVLDRVDADLAELHTGHGPSVFEEPYRHVERAAELARARGP